MYNRFAGTRGRRGRQRVSEPSHSGAATDCTPSRLFLLKPKAAITQAAFIAPGLRRQRCYAPRATAPSARWSALCALPSAPSRASNAPIAASAISINYRSTLPRTSPPPPGCLRQLPHVSQDHRSHQELPGCAGPRRDSLSLTGPLDSQTKLLEAPAKFICLISHRFLSGSYVLTGDSAQKGRVIPN